MIEQLKKNKILLIVFFIVTILFLWTMIGGSSNKPAPILESATAGANPVMDQDIINLLVDMRSIKLDGSLFKSPGFLLLRDFGRDIVAEPIGRTNPFAPIHSASTTKNTTNANDAAFFGK